MRGIPLFVGVGLLSLVGALAAEAQSTDCDTPTNVIPDGRLNSATIPNGAVFWFGLSSSQNSASYAVEADFPRAAAQAASLGVFLPIDVGAGPTCSVTTSSVTTRAIAGLTPEAPNAQRLSFQKTTGGAALFLLRVENTSGASQALTLRVSETTLMNPRWSTFGGFLTSWGFRNTTNTSVTVTLKVFRVSLGVTTLEAEETFAIPANQVAFKSSSGLGIPASRAGFAVAVHDGPPGAIQADGFMVSPDGLTGFPVKFEELRAEVKGGTGGFDGAGGGGGVESVTAGDASIAIGGTVSNPTVAVASAGVTTAKLADGSVTEVKLSFDPATQAELDAVAAGTVTQVDTGLGLTGGPITGSGTVAIDPAVVAQLGEANTFAATLSLDANLALPNTVSDSVGVLMKGGARFLHNFGTGNTFVGSNAGNFTMTGNSNSAFGVGALVNNTDGNSNSAFGGSALSTNTEGNSNSAFGRFALLNNILGDNNSAFGVGALFSNNVGGLNSAFGNSALLSNTGGSGNSAFGSFALVENTTGSGNSAFGNSALSHLSTGNSNLALGPSAGINLISGSNNVYISNLGVSSESDIIRIGSGQTATFLVGTVNAPAFVGDGTGLSNITAADADTLDGLDSTAFAQLAAANNFSGTQTAPDLVATNSISGVTGSFTGNVELPNTTSASVGVLMKGGVRFLHNFGSSNTFVGQNAGNFTMTGNGNSAFGDSALVSNTEGFSNSAFGEDALASNTTGNTNSAFGDEALISNTEGFSNSAFGLGALRSNTTGNTNSAFGGDALFSNTEGIQNSAFGTHALSSNTTGNTNSAFGGSALALLSSTTVASFNSAFGDSALLNLSSGSNNLALGSSAGDSLTSGSDNVYISNSGASSESNTIRIGSGQTATFIAGINGADVGTSSTVLINSAGQLGTVASTRRVKEDIRAMDAASAGLLQLRPVTFRYRKGTADGTKPLQYGLIAEEVAEVMPELVVYDAEGLPQTVQYHVLPALLLNEFQRQQIRLERQEGELASLRELLAAQAAELAETKGLLRQVLARESDGGEAEVAALQ